MVLLVVVRFISTGTVLLVQYGMVVQYYYMCIVLSVDQYMYLTLSPPPGSPGPKEWPFFAAEIPSPEIAEFSLRRAPIFAGFPGK